MAYDFFKDAGLDPRPEGKQPVIKTSNRMPEPFGDDQPEPLRKGTSSARQRFLEGIDKIEKLAARQSNPANRDLCLRKAQAMRQILDDWDSSTASLREVLERVGAL